MNPDVLFKAFPEAVWLPYVVVIVVLIPLILTLSNFYMNVADRRSDTQILDRAEKAASILEKLPAGHRARSDLLTYLTSGPIADLAERHTNREARKREANKRSQRNGALLAAIVFASLMYLPFMPHFFSQTIAEAAKQPTSAENVIFFVLEIAMLMFLVTLTVAILFMFVFFTNKGFDKLAEAAAATGLRYRERRHARKGNGGVYQI